MPPFRISPQQFLAISWLMISVSLLSLSHHSSATKFDCSNLTSSCGCLSQPDKINFEAHCGTLIIKYNFLREFHVECSYMYPQLNPNHFEELEGTTATTDITQLSYLSDINIPIARISRIQHCNVSNSIQPVEDVIRKTKPNSLTLSLMTFENNVLELHRSNKQYDTDLTNALKNITHLYIKGNELSEMPYGMLKDMSALEEVEIINNNFNITNDNIFESNPSLKILRLSSNNITFISGKAFNGLKRLKVLELFANLIDNLDAKLFDDLIALASLELMSNRLTQLDNGVFSKLVKLQLLNLSKNRLVDLPQDLLKHNYNLTSLRLEGNQLNTLPELFFVSNNKLDYLNLNNNNITYLPDGVFNGLTKLTTLNMAHNNLEMIASDWFKSLTSLTTLKLEGNRIATIQVDSFTNLGNLINLDLSYNYLTWLNISTFSEQEHLKQLLLSHNQISIPEADDSFVNYLIELEVLDLSYNQLDNIPLDFVTRVKLTELNMRGNRLTSFNFGVMVNSLSVLSLSVADNNITQVENLPFAELTERNNNQNNQNYQNNQRKKKQLNISGNPLRCDAVNYDLYRYFNGDMSGPFYQAYYIDNKDLICASPEDRVGQSFELVNPCSATYSLDVCPPKCDCYHIPRDNKVIVDCSDKNLTVVPELSLPYDEQYDETRHYCHVKVAPTVIEVILRRNHIKYLQPMSFVKINVTVLDVSFNNLSYVSWIPHGLKSLKLDHNYLQRINKTLLEELSNVTLNNNPWICDCQTEPFWRFLGDNTQTIPNRMEIKCVDTQKSIRKLSPDYLCPSYAKLIVTLVCIGAALVLIPAIFLVFYYKYNQEIKVWLFAHNMCLWFVREEDLDKDKTYDAFISFSQKDEDFVTDHLMPKLEQIPDPYKLCVHMRNWVPGEFIAKQVATSVLNSRRTIVVLSPSFLESVWGKMEFRAAHTKAISEGVARVIIILYDDLDPNDERIDEELRVYLKTNTYIKWGDPWFWDKLKYALPHRKSLHNAAYVNKRFESVSVNLDRMDKMDKINQNVPAINGSANPPVDPLLLKVHPLDINGRCVVNNTPPAEKGIV